MNNQKLKQVLVIVATAGVIFVNYLASQGKIGSITTGAISDKYPTFITPAGSFFAIWSLIYLGLIGFSIYQILPAQTDNPRFRNIRTLYILNCAANCAWLYAWHYEMIVVSFAVMLIILGTLILINAALKNTESIAETWLAHVPFNLYFGWITVATIINSTVMLLFLGVNASYSVTIALASILILTAIALGVLIRFKLHAAAYPLAIAWALTGIAVQQSGKTLIVTLCAIGVIALLIAILTPFLRLHESR